VKFAKGILDGSVKPDFSSQEIPENDVDEGVKVVVGKSFDKIVLDETKDVLLEVYAPWCGHCKALEPAYKRLAARFKDVGSVVVAKMDGTENEHPSLAVEGFPTLLFYPAAKGAQGARRCASVSTCACT
jgi:protein disulfide-isomerase A1